MALPELLEALRAQAAERRAEELARADAEAERIRSRAREESTRQKAERVASAIRHAEVVASKTLAEARAEATASVLVARDRLLARVRAATQARAREAARDPRYRAGLAGELEAALERIPPGEVVVRARPELVEPLERAASNRPGVRVEPVADVGTGFVALSPASGVEIDATLESKLERRWPEIAVAVLAEVGR